MIGPQFGNRDLLAKFSGRGELPWAPKSSRQRHAGGEPWPIRSSLMALSNGPGEPRHFAEETPDGPFVVLASFFRVVLSPHGRGHVLVLLQSPHEANPRAERGNYCSTTMRHSRAIS